MQSTKEKNKIIQILCHSLENDELLNYHILGNWAARGARNIFKYSNKYLCEVWYPVRNLDKKIQFKRDKIIYKLFPAYTLSVTLESFYAILKVPTLFAELKKEKPQNTIIHFQGERGSLLHEVLTKFSSYRITIQFHGYGQPFWLDWLEELLISPTERNNFKNADHFFVFSKPRIEYLKEKIKIPPAKISFQNIGVDLELFKPRNKLQARKKLNLPKKSFILMYVGNLVASKGVDKIIKAYKLLKKKFPQLFLLLIGANITDPLYQMAQKIADKLLGKITNTELPIYYNAADVYCFFGNEKTIKYAGLGAAPGEALASNLNLISTNLIHLPDTIKEKSGFIPKNFSDFLKQIEFLITHPDFQFKPGNLLEKFISIKFQTTQQLKIYDQLTLKKNKFRK